MSKNPLIQGFTAALTPITPLERLTAHLEAAIAEAVELEKARKNSEEKQARDKLEVRQIIAEPQKPDLNKTAHKAADCNVI
jgi:hypothetical protein